MTFLNYTLQAINSALTKDKSLMSKIHGVFDEVPNGAVFPYVVIGEGKEEENNMFNSSASKIETHIDVFSRGDVKGFKTCLDIAQNVQSAIDNNITSNDANLTVLNFLETKPEKIPLDDKTILRHVEIVVEIFAQQK